MPPRKLLFRAPVGWDSSSMNRIWELPAPAYGLSDAPAGFLRDLERSLPRAEDPLAPADVKLQISTFWPLYFVFRGSGGAVGALATENGAVRSCAEPGIFLKVRKYSGRRLGRTSGPRTELRAGWTGGVQGE